MRINPCSKRVTAFSFPLRMACEFQHPGCVREGELVTCDGGLRLSSVESQAVRTMSV